MAVQRERGGQPDFPLPWAGAVDPPSAAGLPRRRAGRPPRARAWAAVLAGRIGGATRAVSASAPTPWLPGDLVGGLGQSRQHHRPDGPERRGAPFGEGPGVIAGRGRSDPEPVAQPLHVRRQIHVSQDGTTVVPRQVERCRNWHLMALRRVQNGSVERQHPLRFRVHRSGSDLRARSSLQGVVAPCRWSSDGATCGTTERPLARAARARVPNGCSSGQTTAGSCQPVAERVQGQPGDRNGPECDHRVRRAAPGDDGGDAVGTRR
jgi:hypothetical protein